MNLVRFREYTTRRLAKCLVMLCLGLFVLYSTIALADQATITRNVNLRRDPSSGHKPIRLLTPDDGIELIDASPVKGYYHVRTDQGEEGWVWSHGVHISHDTGQPNPNPTPPSPTPPSNPTPPANPTPPSNPNPPSNPTPPSDGNPATAISQDWDKPDPNQGSFQGDEGTCGPTGQGGDTATNLRKNRTDVPALYHAVAWDTVSTLAFPSGAPHSRLDWSPDQLAEIKPFEGVAISVVGYLAGIRVETSGNGESTNCHFTQASDVDWHMYFVGSPDQGEASAVIAETTPRVRQLHPNWTTEKLAPWTKTGQQVRLSGWLMLDPEHPDAIGQARGTIWEIHPVMKIEVLQNDQWVDLDNLP